MTQWEQYQFQERIIRILEDTTYYRPGHCMGRPFLTPYQIAIEFAGRFPEDFEIIGLPIGGENTGMHNSLARYIAAQLSRKLQRRELSHIEGGFLGNLHLRTLEFNNRAESVKSSLTKSEFDLSIFRYID